MHLVLYISGSSARSQLAVERARRLCSETLAGRAVLEVVDVLVDPREARAAGVRITPTLALGAEPGGVRAQRVFGDLDERQAVLAALGLSLLGASA